MIQHHGLEKYPAQAFCVRVSLTNAVPKSGLSRNCGRKVFQKRIVTFAVNPGGKWEVTSEPLFIFDPAKPINCAGSVTGSQSVE